MAKKKQQKLRWYAHPQEPPLQVGADVFMPGKRVPVEKMDPQVVKRMMEAYQIVPEHMFKLAFGAAWNAMYPRKKVKVEDLNPDVPVPTPDHTPPGAEVFEIRTGTE